MGSTRNLNVVIPPDLIEAAERGYAKQALSQELPPASPTALVRYALALLAGQDGAAWAKRLPKGPGAAQRREVRVT